MEKGLDVENEIKEEASKRKTRFDLTIETIRKAYPDVEVCTIENGDWSKYEDQNLLDECSNFLAAQNIIADIKGRRCIDVDRKDIPAENPEIKPYNKEDEITTPDQVSKEEFERTRNKLCNQTSGTCFALYDKKTKKILGMSRVSELDVSDLPDDISTQFQKSYIASIVNETEPGIAQPEFWDETLEYIDTPCLEQEGIKDKICEFNYFYVDPTEQRKGYGTALLALSTVKAIENGYKTARGTSNPDSPAIPLMDKYAGDDLKYEVLFGAEGGNFVAASNLKIRRDLTVFGITALERMHKNLEFYLQLKAKTLTVPGLKTDSKTTPELKTDSKLEVNELKEDSKLEVNELKEDSKLEVNELKEDLKFKAKKGYAKDDAYEQLQKHDSAYDRWRKLKVKEENESYREEVAKDMKYRNRIMQLEQIVSKIENDISPNKRKEIQQNLDICKQMIPTTDYQSNEEFYNLVQQTNSLNEEVLELDRKCVDCKEEINQLQKERQEKIKSQELRPVPKLVAGFDFAELLLESEHPTTSDGGPSISTGSSSNEEITSITDKHDVPLTSNVETMQNEESVVSTRKYISYEEGDKIYPRKPLVFKIQKRGQGLLGKTSTK